MTRPTKEHYKKLEKIRNSMGIKERVEFDKMHQDFVYACVTTEDNYDEISLEVFKRLVQMGWRREI